MSVYVKHIRILPLRLGSLSKMTAYARGGQTSRRATLIDIDLMYYEDQSIQTPTQ